MEHGKLAIIAIFVALAIILSVLALIAVKYALIFVAVAFIVLLLFFKPFYGLLLYLVLLYIRPQDFIPALGRLRVVMALAVIITIFYFIHKIFRRQEIPAFSTRQHVLMFVLLLLVPVSYIVNGRMFGLWEATQEFLTLFLLFFIIVSIPGDFREFRTICWTLFTCTSIIAADGIIQHFRGTDLVGQTPVVGRIRWIGLFADPNELALLIDSFFPFVLVEVFDRGVRPVGKVLLALIGVVMVAAVYFTNSRGGFIAFLAILLFFSYKRWGLLRGIAVSTVFLIAGLLIAPSRMAMMDPYEISASQRVDAWTDGLSSLKSHPVLGTGYHTFRLLHGVAPHSATIECLADLGLIGYFVWLTMLYSSITGLLAFEKRCPSSPYRKYATILQLSFIGFLGSALFLSQAYSPVLYILVALAALVIKSESETVIQPRILSPRETVWITVILVGSIVGYKLLAMLYY
jgi:putative inorganic carbon (HCO3(-)) transporter